jgi:hypothetical protein
MKETMSKFIESRLVAVALRLTAAAVLTLSLAGSLTGCGGAEKATPTAAPVGSVPGGTSQDEYAKHMKEMGSQQRGAGSSSAPIGAPPATK